MTAAEKENHYVRSERRYCHLNHLKQEEYFSTKYFILEDFFNIHTNEDVCMVIENIRLLHTS